MPTVAIPAQKPMHTAHRVEVDGAVDADGHILEPPDLWVDYIDPQYRDRALRIVPDEDNPYAVLSAQDEGGDALAEVKVDASFKLNRQTAQAWVDAGFAKPGSGRR